MNKYLAAGIAAGIVAPSALIFGINMWQRFIGSSDYGQPEWSLGRHVMFALLPMGYALPAVLLYGLPVFLILRRFRLANLYTCILTALAPIAIAAQLGWTRGAGQKTFSYGALFLLSGLSFWVFARKSVVRDHHA